MARTGRIVALVFLAGCLLLFVVPTTSPVQVSYATSNSMSPTIGVGDGYVLVPPGEVTEGEIITYWSAQRNSYVTHRVAEVRPEGFVTRGDNNPVTDQLTGHPYVQREEVVGQVLTVAGRPVVIPGLGTAIQFLSTNRFSVLAVSALVVVLVFATTSTPARHVRQLTVREVARPILGLAILTSLLLVLHGTAAVQASYLALPPGHAENPGVVTVGEPATRTVTVELRSSRLTHVIFRSSDVELVDRVDEPSRAGVTNATVTLLVPPSDRVGIRHYTIRAFAYPATLPRAWLERAHDANRLFAACLSITPPYLVLAVLYVVIFDTRRPLRTPPRRWLHRLLEEGEP